MGLFSSKTEIVVGTVASRVIKDESLPNAIKTGVLKSIFQSGDMTDYMMEEMAGSIGLRADRMYEYGRTTYAHGLPSGQFRSAADGLAEVTAVLQGIDGPSALVTYSHYGPPNYLHIGWCKLFADHGYDLVTNQFAGLTAAKGWPVYLEDMVVVVPSIDGYEAGALDQWGTTAKAGYTPARKFLGSAGEFQAATPVQVDASATAAHVRVTYIWEIPVGVGHPEAEILRETFTISLAEFDEAADYFHVKYKVGDAVKYWMYKDNSGTYPTLDAVFQTEAQPNGTFFPFAYFRYGKVSDISDKTTQAYLTSKRLVKYLGMDYDQVAEAVDENPDIADVEQAMMIMAVPAVTSDPDEMRYLFSFFDNMFYASDNQFDSPIRAGMASGFMGGTDLTKASLIIQDRRFKMAVTHNGIYKRRVTGSIGAIGTHTHLVDTIYVEEKYEEANETNSFLQTRSVPIKVQVYRRQISKDLYDELRVVNLKTLYFVLNDQYYVTADETDDILLIPLDRSITHTYSVPDRERLYARSLHYVFNSVLYIKIKWYQQMWFEFVMAVVAAVLAFVTYGKSIQLLIAAMSSVAAMTAAVAVLLENLLMSLLISQAFKLFVKAVGGELALVIAVVAAVVAGASMLNTGSISGAPWAQELLQLSTGLGKGAQAYYADELKGLAADYQADLAWQKEATEELNSAQKLLENNNYLSPFVIFGESPNEFYNRTIHSGNIGVLGISAISNYVDTALRLPKLDDTIGDTAYV